MNGYNFTERVRRVLAAARDAAAQLGHEYVGTEHILLGVIGEREGVAAAVLEHFGVVPSELRRRVEESVKKGAPARATGPDLPYTSRAKKVLELAMSEARDLGHSYVGTEHLLLGLLCEERGVAAQVLLAAGLTAELVRDEVAHLVGETVPARSPSRAPESASARGKASTLQDTLTTEWRAWLRLRSALDVAEKLGGPVSIRLRDDGTVVVPLGTELIVEVTGLPIRRGSPDEGAHGSESAR